MPNPPAHINLASQVAKLLRHDAIDRNMGPFLLGSTSPDIRVITRKDRACYHFATLDFDAVGAGVQGLFHSHPNLGDARAHSEPTQAFIAGYLTHLMADETWIANMFRPFFGNPAVFQDKALGLIMDRAMQLELDRRSWARIDPLRALLGASPNAAAMSEAVTDAVAVDFIPTQTLADWAQWVAANLDRGFSWERLRFMARRIASGEEDHPAYKLADDFVADADRGLERIYQHIPRTSPDQYEEAALASIADAVQDYLP